MKKATWADYPEQDAILIGTQDMLLSRSRSLWVSPKLKFADLENRFAKLAGAGSIQGSADFRNTVAEIRAECTRVWSARTFAVASNGK